MRVAKHTCNLYGLVENALDGALSIDGIAGQHLWKHATWDGEEAQQVVIPLHSEYVEKHGARGIGGVGGKGLATCEFPYKPSVNRAHEQFATFGLLACALNVVEQPFHTRC